ncbi:uncharacterized protein LOC142337419 [Convolutriloba macropyga]|uniref:uncharacterized protein LOC142337419 n=1 Tax=Convolutriloba macropyga TaxID=536237 RepID=UPI003F5265F3
MSVSRIEQWLSSIGFKQYTQLFIDNGYDDFELCKHLKENDLDLMGITIPIVKAEILSSVNNLKDAPNAAHVYFSMDPNYWQADGTVHSKASTIRNYLREQNDSGIIHENEGNDVYNVVMQELTKDEITPTMLLSFPVTLKSRMPGASGSDHSRDKMSDSGNDSDPEEIYCAQDLASIYEERLSIPHEKILNVLHCIQRLHCRRPESRNHELRLSHSVSTSSSSHQFDSSTTRRRPHPLQPHHNHHMHVQERMSSFESGAQPYDLNSHSRNLSQPANTAIMPNHPHYASKTLGRILPSYQKPRNVVVSPPIGPSTTIKAARSQNITFDSREADLSPYNTNQTTSSNTTGDFSSSNSIDSAAYLLK